MFTKLRNKFLILNMSITSMMMIAAFAIIYFITYSNIHSEIQSKLSSRTEMQTRIEGADSPEDADKERNVNTYKSFSSGDSLLFNIEVDGEGKVLNIDSSINMSDEVFYKATQTAWNNKKNYSTITLEGKQWEYNIAPITTNVIQEDGKQYTQKENKYQIVFLDVTAYNKTLFQLFITLLLVGLIMIFVIFIISLYFAGKAIKPIAETWEKQKQFVADASHELKTPLSIINANYDVLLANQEETIKSQLKWLSYIGIGADRMAKLVNELLSLAKIEDANLKTQKIPFNISSSINEVILSMDAAVLEKGIKLSYSIEPDIIIKSDLERVKQVASILLDNAVKYTNENGQIYISLSKSKRQVICSIKNSGKGIAKQDLPKVFDRFFRADPSRTHESGSYGLGLSIAKAIIDSLGGEIHVKSIEDEFTTFNFTLSL